MKCVCIRTNLRTHVHVCSWSAPGHVHSDPLTRDSCGVIFILLCGVS